MNSLKVKKDDIVQVTAGKDRGKRGKVLSVVPKNGRLLIEKINIVKKHQRPNQQTRQGGIIEKENHLRVDNVKVVCQKCDQAIRVGKKKLEDGHTVRICRKCGEVLDAV